MQYLLNTLICGSIFLKKNTKLLIVTSKCPDVQPDFDGGSILINQLLKFVNNNFDKMDIIYLRNTNCSHSHKNINKIETIPQTTKQKNKFLQRIDNAHNTFNIIQKKSTIYDKIIITHISNAFYLEKLDNEQLQKIIIFPMFMSNSYIKSNEIVPIRYINMEKKVFTKDIKIITPSLEEKQQLISSFGAKKENITVIPRGFDLNVFYKKHNSNLETLNIVSIGAIRKQKNHIEMIDICLYLIKNNIDFVIHLVGGNEEEYKDKFTNAINQNNLNKYILFHNILTPEKLSKLMDNCDVNISVSHMETFGRGIYEGLLKGLPTIVFNHLHCLWENLDKNHGIVGVSKTSEFSEEIIKLHRDKKYYNEMQEKAFSYRKKFNEDVLVNRIYKDILL